MTDGIEHFPAIIGGVAVKQILQHMRDFCSTAMGAVDVVVINAVFGEMPRKPRAIAGFRRAGKFVQQLREFVIGHVVICASGLAGDISKLAIFVITALVAVIHALFLLFGMERPGWPGQAWSSPAMTRGDVRPPTKSNVRFEDAPYSAACAIADASERF